MRAMRAESASGFLSGVRGWRVTCAGVSVKRAREQQQASAKAAARLHADGKRDAWLGWIVVSISRFGGLTFVFEQPSRSVVRAQCVGPLYLSPGLDNSTGNSTATRHYDSYSTSTRQDSSSDSSTKLDSYSTDLDSYSTETPLTTP